MHLSSWLVIVNGGIFTMNSFLVCSVLSLLLLKSLAWSQTLSSTAHNHSVYVVSSAENKIEQYHQNSITGQLTLVESVACCNLPYAIAIDYTGKFAYTVCERENSIIFYEIDPDSGHLTPRAKANTQIQPNNLIIAARWESHNLKQYMYISNQISNSLNMFQISPAGNLVPLQPATIKTGLEPHGLAIDPEVNLLYVTSLISNSLNQYEIDPDGRLKMSSITPLIASSQPWSISVSKNGKNVYIVHQSTNSISIFSLERHQGHSHLQPLNPAQIKTGNYPYDLVFNPSQSYAYIPNWQENSLSAYQVDPKNGQLLSLSTIATGIAPRSLAFSTDGNFVYVLNQQENSISMYKFNSADGSFIPLKPAKITTGREPYHLIFN